MSLRLPQVSICIPARDHGAYLERALDSVLTQDFVDLEVVVHDDASSDDTHDVVASCRDIRVRYARTREPIGVARARNSCLSRARGRYIAWLDADDEYLPGALGRMLSLLDTHPDVALAHGGFDVVNRAGRPLPPWPAPFAADAVEHGADAFPHLLAANEITTSTVVVPRAAHNRAGPFRVGPGTSSSDWAMWLRLALHGGIAYSAEPVARYRQHPATISRATARNGERLRCDIAVVRDLLRTDRKLVPGRRRARKIASAALAAKALHLAGDLFTCGEHDASLRAVLLAARLAPTAKPGAMARLALATQWGDGDGCYRANLELLARLAEHLEGTRFGTRLADASRPNDEWDGVLERAAQAVRRVTPGDATVGAVTKWDPTLLRLADRSGLNFPDRSELPDGYPADGAQAVAHLESLRRRRGMTHLVFTSASFWWLDHYRELSDHLEDSHTRLLETDECIVYALGERTP